MRRPLFGVVLKLASTVVFAIMIVFVKLVADRVPPGEVVFFRSFFGALPAIVMMVWQGQMREAFYTTRPFGHLFRSFAGVGSMFLGFAAYQRLPLADALAIAYAAPLLTVVVAALTLGETVRIYRWTAVAVGFGGVIVMLWPHLGSIEHLGTDRAAVGALMAFVSAFFTAFASTQVRRLTLMNERTSTIVVYFSFGCALISLTTIPFGWVMPTANDAILLVAAGLIGGVGQLMVTRAYAFADASIVAPLEYVSILWAVLFGWWLFGELPGETVIFGGAIVIASGLVIVLREHRIGIRRSPEDSGIHR